MSHIKIEFGQLQDIIQFFPKVSNQLLQANKDFMDSISRLDWQVKSKNDINYKSKQIAKHIRNCGDALLSYEKFVNGAYSKYKALDQYLEKSEPKKTVQNNISEYQVTHNKFTTKKKETYVGSEEVIAFEKDEIVGTKTVSTNKGSYEKKTSPQGEKVKYKKTLYEDNFQASNGYVNEDYSISGGLIEAEWGNNTDIVELVTAGYKEGKSYDIIYAGGHLGATGIHYTAGADGKKGKVGSEVSLEGDILKGDVDAHVQAGINENGALVGEAKIDVMLQLAALGYNGSVTFGDIKCSAKVTGYIGIGGEAGVSYDGEKLKYTISVGFVVGLGVEVTIEPTGELKKIIDKFTNIGDVINGIREYGMAYGFHLAGLW